MLSNAKPFRISITAWEKAPDIGVVEISGYLDTHTVAEFDKMLLEDGKANFRSFVIDLSDLRYISSAGIASLMRLVQMARKRNGDVALLKAGEQVCSLLELLGFSEFFRFSDTREEAVAHLCRES